jgi:hypothetical protein
MPVMRWLALVAFFALITSMWQLYSRQNQRDDALKSTQTDALRDYVTRSPFDAAGHLAIAAEGVTTSVTPTAEANIALAAAKTLAPFDPDVLRLSVLRSLQARDADGAIAAGERLAAIDPTAQSDVVKALATLGTAPAWNQTIERWQATRSPLLDELVFNVCQSDAPIAQKLQLATAASAANLLSNRSFECLRGASLRSAEYLSIYALWIDRVARRSPGESLNIPHVFNGDFSRAIEAEPFDWKLGAGGDFRDGYVVRIRREMVGSVANRYLEAELNGRPVKTDIASISTALSRGRYALSYRIRDTSQAAGHRFRLSLRCVVGPELTSAGLDKVTAPSQGAGTSDWVISANSFSVPENCFAQQLSLESTRAGWKALGASGRIAIDDVVISSVSEAQ